MNLFAPDGRLFAAWWQWWFWVRTSVCFVLLCLPVITAPAAIVWLITEQRNHRAGEAAAGMTTTIQRIRSSLVPALALGVHHLLAAALVTIGLLGPMPEPFSWVVLAVSATVAVTWLLLTPWSWVVLERSRSAREALKVSYAVSLRRIELAVTSLVIIGVAVMLISVLPTLVLAFLLPALPAALADGIARLCDRATGSTQLSQATAAPTRPVVTLGRKAYR